ncbi:MAG: hypothetical protein BWY63_03682 [Chloroflexi bacterium ADurb.Bin360]|nr:MAG: hypothetical protein BWY63_03682 [Chloroflexi bacterium ADurb.Bin360]
MASTVGTGPRLRESPSMAKSGRVNPPACSGEKAICGAVDFTRAKMAAGFLSVPLANCDGSAFRKVGSYSIVVHWAPPPTSCLMMGMSTSASVIIGRKRGSPVPRDLAPRLRLLASSVVSPGFASGIKASTCPPSVTLGEGRAALGLGGGSHASSMIFCISASVALQALLLATNANGVTNSISRPTESRAMTWNFTCSPPERIQKPLALKLATNSLCSGGLISGVINVFRVTRVNGKPLWL